MDDAAELILILEKVWGLKLEFRTTALQFLKNREIEFCYNLYLPNGDQYIESLDSYVMDKCVKKVIEYMSGRRITTSKCIIELPVFSTVSELKMKMAISGKY